MRVIVGVVEKVAEIHRTVTSDPAEENSVISRRVWFWKEGTAEDSPPPGSQTCLYRNPHLARGGPPQPTSSRIAEPAIAARDFSWSLSDIISPTRHNHPVLCNAAAVCAFRDPTILRQRCHGLQHLFSCPEITQIRRDAGKGGYSASATF